MGGSPKIEKFEHNGFDSVRFIALDIESLFGGFVGENYLFRFFSGPNLNFLKDSVFMFEGLSYQEIATLFKRHKIIISGGSPTKRHMLSFLQLRLSRFILSITTAGVVNSYHITDKEDRRTGSDLTLKEKNITSIKEQEGLIKISAKSKSKSKSKSSTNSFVPHSSLVPKALGCVSPQGFYGLCFTMVPSNTGNEYALNFI